MQNKKASPLIGGGGKLLCLGLKGSAKGLAGAIGAVRAYCNAACVTAVLLCVIYAVLNVTDYALDTFSVIAAAALALSLFLFHLFVPSLLFCRFGQI